MAHEIIFGMGRDFKATAEQELLPGGGFRSIQFTFEGKVDSTKSRDWMNALWNALKDAFRDSNVMKMESVTGKLDSQIYSRKRELGDYVSRDGELCLTVDMMRNYPGSIPNSLVISLQGSSDVSQLKPFLPTGDSDPASVEKQIIAFVDTFKRQLRQKLQHYISRNNNDLWC